MGLGGLKAREPSLAALSTGGELLYTVPGAERDKLLALAKLYVK